MLVAVLPNRSGAWRELLCRAGYSGAEAEERFDRVIEAAATDAGADMIEDTPVGFGNPIGERHTTRWIRRMPKSGVENPTT